MHPLVIDAIADADYCNRLEVLEYSTNPRFYVTIGDMIQHHIERELEVSGA